jgi:hypothetical protein
MNSSQSDGLSRQFPAYGTSDEPVTHTPAFDFLADEAAPASPIMRPPAYLYPPPSSLLAPAQPSWPGKGLALAGFLLSLAGLLLWLIPYLGDLLALTGFACCILAWRAPKRKWMVIAGCSFALATIALGVSNAFLSNTLFPH